ncbi:MAG: ribosomal protein S18-alanine N-acetyltransferase [Lachnospiraceae bacterium]|nr:ribosomal protein S18-alanine N-acetyltransferase [Lachnospiraceae bacterium]
MRSLITFRKMTTEDLDAVSQMEKRIFSMPWSRDAYEKALADQNVVYVVAKDGNRVVGSCGVRNILSEGEVTNVMIDLPYRKRGISYPMLTKLLAMGEAMGIRRFFLEVRCSNEPAIRLYRKCGFESAGVRRGLYERPAEDGLVMWKR